MARLKRLLSGEPLVHFVLAAALLFGLYAWTGAGEAPEKTAEERTIRITAAETRRLAALYASEAGAPATAAEIRRLLHDHVEERVLAREARRLGLDQGDAIVERRLAQKMRLTLADYGEVAPPEEAALRAWVAENRDRFERPGLYSFDHVFFKDPTSPAIADARERLGDPATDWRSLGEPFMLGRQAGELPLREIKRRYGRDFAEALVPLAPGPEWRGPIRSAFGAHLLRLTARTPPRLPPFEAVRETAAAAWAEERRRERIAAEIARLVAGYAVVVEAPAETVE